MGLLGAAWDLTRYKNRVSSHVLSAEKVKSLLEESGAVLRGHFRLASGRHSDVYVEKFRIIERPDLLSQVVESIVAKFRDSKPKVVAGPTTGGIIIAFEVARQLGIPAVYVEEKDGKRVIKRGAHIEEGARVLVVDDVLTTGISLREVIEVLRTYQANVVGVGVLIDRTETPLDFGAELFATCRFEATTYAEDELPEWLAAIPLQTPGTRALRT